MRRLPKTAVLWASPICTELSPAGGRRRQTAQLDLLEEAGHVAKNGLDRTRATFWDVVRATELHRYKVVLIENVVEAASWELFDVWIAAMTKLGYNHQFASVSSAHIGDDANPHAPQWRDRLYVTYLDNCSRSGGPAALVIVKGCCTYQAHQVAKISAASGIPSHATHRHAGSVSARLIARYVAPNRAAARTPCRRIPPWASRSPLERPPASQVRLQRPKTTEKVSGNIGTNIGSHRFGPVMRLTGSRSSVNASAAISGGPSSSIARRVASERSAPFCTCAAVPSIRWLSMSSRTRARWSLRTCK